MTSPIDAPLEPGLYLPTADRRVVMYGRTWADYEAQLALQGEPEAGVPRRRHRADEPLTRSRNDQLADRARDRRGSRPPPHARDPERRVDAEGPGERGRRATRRVLLVRRGVRLQAETGPGARGREGESTSSRSIGAWRSRRFWEEGEILVYALHAGTDVRRERSQFLPDLDLTFVCSLLHLSVGAIHDAVRDRVSGG